MLFFFFFDRQRGEIVSMVSHADGQHEQVGDERLLLELRLRSGINKHEVVVLEAVDEEALRKTHARYFKSAEALVPTAPSSATSCGTVAAGVHITASSAGVGNAPTDGNARWPATVDRRLLIGQIAPVNVPPIRFLNTVAPTLCGRSEAPITAIDLALNRYSRLRTDTVDE